MGGGLWDIDHAPPRAPGAASGGWGWGTFKVTLRLSVEGSEHAPETCRRQNLQDVKSRGGGGEGMRAMLSLPAWTRGWQVVQERNLEKKWV